MDQDISSCSLNSEPELDLLLPIELLFPPVTDIRVLEEEEEAREEGMAMMLSSRSDVVTDTGVVVGRGARGRLPLC